MIESTPLPRFRRHCADGTGVAGIKPEKPVGSPYMLMYDIPDSAEIANPTGWLLPIAVRINKSVWVIQEDDIPHRLLANLEREGATWYTLPFDVRAMGDITKLVVESLTKEIRDTVARSRQAIGGMMHALETSDAPITKALAKYRTQTNATVKKLGKTLQSLRSAARCFAVPPERIGYAKAASSLGSLKTAVLAAGKAVLEAAAELEGVEPGSLMAKAARNGKVPPGILADYLQDQGRDATANKLRGLFYE